MKKGGFLIVFSFVVLIGNCQSSFEITINRPLYDYSHSSIEVNNIYYTMGILRDSNDNANGTIVKYDNESNLFIKEIIKNDSSTALNFGIEKTNNNILVFGWMQDTSLLFYLYVCELTADLEIVMEKYHYIIPDDYDYIAIYDMVINEDNHVVFAGHFDDYGGSSSNCFVLVELDSEGNLINYNYEENVFYDGEQSADLVLKNDGTGYYYFGGGSYKWVEFNNNLEYINGGFFFDPSHHIGYHISAKYLSNGNLMFAGMTSSDSSLYDLHIPIGKT
ncbi:MAG: hypothetical protein B6D61_04810 [Bacteroidetes bacterium 4484_249]|nr:MAG: hypothetical protein B6D61_04810 [Bacteroidetes bacterium 4484_249]